MSRRRSRAHSGTRRALVAGLSMLSIVGMLVVDAPASGAAEGVDISKWQHPGSASIDWGQVRASGRTFAFMKASEDVTYANEWFDRDWSGAGGAGLYRGAYHFARPALPLSTAVDQARFFVSVTGTMHGSRDLPPVLDLENNGGLAPADLTSWTLTWLREVQRLTGRAPIIYTGYYFWQDQLGSTTALSAYRLWLPSWTDNPANVLTPPTFGAWTFWQYSNVGSVPGIPAGVDLDRYCCPDANLRALGGGTANPAASNPFGSLDSAVSRPDAVNVRGWAIDPDTTNPVQVHVYVDGHAAAALTANVSRQGVANAWPGFGALHGFSASVPATPGNHVVCVYAINRGAGTSNPLLGCQFVVNTPYGSVDGAMPEPGGTAVRGWAIGPDTVDPLRVHLYFNGKFLQAVTANQTRTDVGAANPAYGSAHGFTATIPNRMGVLCAYGINDVAGGTNALLGCRIVNTNPVGRLDAIGRAPGRIAVRGWALDPETTGPIDVHAYVDGHAVAVLHADLSRPDLATHYPANGINHGYAGHLSVGHGNHVVCLYAINVGTGTANPLVTCRFVVNTPIGSLDSATRGASSVRVVGWTIGRDTAQPLAVHVYVDGNPVGAAIADVSRPDVATVYPAFGANHGFDVSVPLAPGGHSVCVYAINDVSGGVNPLVGCRTV